MAGDKTDAAPRKRALVSCDRCKLRRARCIRDNPKEPCADCKMSGVQCESKLPRKQRVYGSVETLSLRYRALEALAKGLFPDENTQDVNALYKIAASRNIPMPASDDFAPAAIFSSNTQQSPSQTQHQTQAQQSQRQNQNQEQEPGQMSPQPISPTMKGLNDPLLAVDATFTSSPTRDKTQQNHFWGWQQPSRLTDELIPTRHGVSHYFGPSSSFRIATTICGLVARYKAVSGVDIRSRASGSVHSEPSSRYEKSLRHNSINLSDDEDNGTVSTGRSTQERKQSSIQSDETEEQWNHIEGSSSTYIIGDLLPSRSLADALVSAYFDHVHVYLPLFHRSMFQFRLEATYSQKSEPVKSCTDIGWLVALALVFSFGCRQLHEHDPEQAHKLRMKYLHFARTYFRELLTATSLVNVQALVLLIIHHHTVGEKSSSWLLIGLAARMAIAMGMHRDGPNMTFDPIERNTRRQVWWSIYTFEKILCSILGRPTVVDDREVSAQFPEATGMSPELIALSFEVFRMSYTVRQRAYFDALTAQERTPPLMDAEALLRDCDNFFATIPAHLSLDFLQASKDQRAGVLLLHMYYFYMRCTVTRDFLIQKVERNICHLENKQPPYSEDLSKALALSEDCVESAHRSIQCIMAGTHLGIIGYSWLDLFFVFHSVLIVCADFLARPKDQIDSVHDEQRKETVRAMLNHVRGLKKLSRTYSILGQIAMQFASITGVDNDPNASQRTNSQPADQSFGSMMMRRDGPAEHLVELPPEPGDGFANATSNLGLDFFDLNQATRTIPMPMQMDVDPSNFYMVSSTTEPDNWTGQTLQGMYI